MLPSDVWFGENGEKGRFHQLRYVKVLHRVIFRLGILDLYSQLFRSLAG